jgi:hypothetical protein
MEMPLTRSRTATHIKVRLQCRHDSVDQHEHLPTFKVPRKAKHEPVLVSHAAFLRSSLSVPHVTAHVAVLAESPLRLKWKRRFGGRLRSYGLNLI